MNIVTAGRKDLAAFFEQSDILRRGASNRAIPALRGTLRLTHTPLLVFHIVDDSFTVHIVDTARGAAENPSYGDMTPVMCQWRGRWSSDYFQFTIGELREALRAETS